MNNYKVKPASSTRSAMLKMEQQISDNLSSVRELKEEIRKTEELILNYQNKRDELQSELDSLLNQ